MKANLKLTLIISLALVTSCDRQNCNIEQRDFEIDNAPMIRKVKGVNECEVNFDLYLKKNEKTLNGRLELINDAIWLIFRADKKTILFDFNLTEGAQYRVDILSEKYTMTLSKIYPKQNFVFVMSEGYYLQDTNFDIVFVVTPKEGVIGSYLSHTSGDSEIITAQRGDRLEEYIDYSEKEIVMIK